MLKRTYNWRRFWYPSGTEVTLVDGAFLPDPEEDWSRFHNPEVRPLDALSDVPCLALVGEPGIGKSVEIASDSNRLQAKAAQSGGLSLHFNLAEYGDDSKLTEEVFRHPVLQSWVNSAGRLYLFLDSLDEGRLCIRPISSILLRELRRLPHDRLFLRIGCRAAEWPLSLEDRLRQLWPETSVKVYHLAPLCRKDAVLAIRENGLDAEQLLGELERRDALAFASKPVTLAFLLDLRLQDKPLPDTREELYLQGCQRLCVEISRSRRDFHGAVAPTPKQRLDIAACIAALMVFGDKSAIATESDTGDASSSDIRADDLCDLNQDARGGTPVITRPALDKTLNTPLFVSRGPGRLGWAHQTYAEFLAALYLKNCQMTLKQVMSLLTTPDDPDDKLAPQLYDVAAWLSTMLPGLFDRVVNTDPEILLSSDVTALGSEHRSSLAAALLARFDRGELTDILFFLKDYARLSHPGLADQVRPWLLNRHKGWHVRRQAFRIAAACQLSALQQDLLAVACDLAEEYDVRCSVVHALSTLADDTTKAKLLPFALGQAGDDPDDELKGWSLTALWPHRLSTRQVLPLLSEPRRHNFGGAYYSFLHMFAHSIPSQDLPDALAWIQHRDPEDLGSIFGGFADDLILRAWDLFESPRVADHLAAVVLARLKQSGAVMTSFRGSDFEKRLAADDDRRRRLVVAMLPLVQDLHSDAIRIAHGQPPLISSPDMPWLIDKTLSAPPGPLQAACLGLIDTLASASADQQVSEALFVACRSHPVLQRAFAHYFEPVPLDSPQVRAAQDQHLQHQLWEKRRQQRDPPFDAEKAVRDSLNRVDAGDLVEFLVLLDALAYDPDSRSVAHRHKPDVTSLPVWQQSDLPTRERTVAAAKRYLLEQPAGPHTWLEDPPVWTYGDFAACKALRLLAATDPDFLGALPEETWCRWTPAVVASSTLFDTETEGLAQNLVTLAYRWAPEQVLETTRQIIARENRRTTDSHHVALLLPQLTGCWDQPLIEALFAEVRSPQLRPHLLDLILEQLLAQHVPGARALAESLVPSPPPPLTAPCPRARAVAAASALLTHADDAGWTTVYPALCSDPDFGREVIAVALSHREWQQPPFLQRLTPERLADLYIWVRQHCPTTADPFGEVNRLRDFIVQRIKECGTRQACTQIERIVAELPDAGYLNGVLSDIRRNARRKAWHPIRPEHLLALAHNREARFVQSHDHLLDLLLESLERLQQRLQGGAARFLWDERPLPRPKDESAFSDYVADHLREDLVPRRGIVVNREVRVQRGKKTDIYINAIAKDAAGHPADTLTLIIECKGSWHQQLYRAMEAQLVGHYMKGSHCHHGLYLVGCFNCAKWDAQDPRCRRAKSRDIITARTRLEENAAAFSTPPTRVRAFVLDASLP